jgi:hypothetical protein
MPTHARAVIVAAAVQALTGLGTTGTRVHAGRTAPKSAGALPYLLIYGRGEQSVLLTMNGPNRKLQRELLLVVEGVAGETADVDDTQNAIALDVETALAADPTLGGKARDLFLSRTTINAQVDGETRLGLVRLEFTVLYQTVATAPGSNV